MRKQCKRCPWKKTTGKDIPNGFRDDADEALAQMCAGFNSLRAPSVRQQCHTSTDRDPLICVGYAAHALGPGNDLALRIERAVNPAAFEFELDGEQHEDWRDVVPRSRP